MYLRKIIQYTLCASVIPVLGIFILYGHWIGFPRKIGGHWVHPSVTWYMTGYPPLGYPFPGIVQYVYKDAHGREIKHGPLIERGIRGNGVVLSKTGYYIEDQPDGVFTEYQTYWGTKLKEITYDHGKQESVVYYPVPNLGQ
jgi:hypothetical protein